MAPRPHRSITSLVTEWNRLCPLLTTDSTDFLTYTHGLVSSLPPTNYSRSSMNMIDHLYISILPRLLHATIRQFFSAFVTQQQRAHERRFPRSRTTPYIMSVYWDHVKTYTKKTPELLDAMNCLQPAQDMKLYRLILKAWNKVSIALFQRARNLQTIVEALIRNHSRVSTRLKKRNRSRYTIPEPCGLTLVHTLLPASLRPPSTDTPTSTPIYTNPQRHLPCDHDRCRLYETENHRGGFVIGRALCCPVYQIFNYVAKHTYHVERALRSRPRLRASLSCMSYIPGKDTALITTRFFYDTQGTPSAGH